MTARSLAADAWLFRAGVEHDATVRFERLAGELARLEPDSPVVGLLAHAAGDERRHFVLCLELACSLGARPPLAWPIAAPIVPAGLAPREAVLYELVAACCITETESMATLTALLQHDAEPEIAAAVRAIARDEVRHAQLGWAHLARARQAGPVGFLAPLIPRMLAGGAGDLFDEGDAAAEDPGLRALGVLPRAQKREVFLRALDEVILPGLALHGVDDAPARAWLAGRRAAVS